MSTRLELFKNQKLKEGKRKSRRPEFEAVIDGFGIETIDKTGAPHECFACQLPIGVGSRAEKQTPVVDDRPQWQYAKYKHLPKCPPPEDEPR